MARMPTRVLVCASISVAVVLMGGPAVTTSITGLANAPSNALDTARVLVHYKVDVSAVTKSEIIILMSNSPSSFVATDPSPA